MTDLMGAALPGADCFDDDTVALDRYCHEVGLQYRGPGVVLDRDPDAVEPILALPGVRFAQYGFLPPPYRDGLDVPHGLADAAHSCLGGVIACERFAYGDPGVMLASPGPSLSGGVIEAIADPAQYDRYFSRIAQPSTHTFFALTEPNKGSAVMELETLLTRAPDGDGWLLNGEKRYIGNGSRAPVGVVFCRRAPGPLGIEAVLVDTSAPGFTAMPLPTMGLRGARISRLRFENVRIAPQDLLGAHLPPSRRGLRGALHILYRFRPGIAAMALGCTQAACDYLRQRRPALPKAERLRLEGLLDRVFAIRRLTYRAAADVDAGRVNVARIGGVKAQAAALAEAATLLVAELLGPAALVEHPWLEKVYRDVRAFELMEGTTNLHLLAVYQGLRKNSYLAE
jgi:alkylation response protein AidB-like acyl-CoA dehydrogenase